jgi:hypothetical protein
MKLTTTNDKLQIVLGGSVTTNQLQCVTSYKIFTTSATTDGKIAVNTNNTTDVDLAGAPSSGEVYDIQNINIFNNDTASATVTIKLNVSGTETILYKGVVGVNDVISWSGEGGWRNTSNNILPLLNNRKCVTGALYETFDRDLCDEVISIVLATGRLSLQAIYLPAGTTINSISIWSASTAAGTPTNQLFGLYDINLNLLRSSVNDTTTAWAANSRKTLALTSAFTTTSSGLYYLGIMVAATTVPTLKGNTTKNGGQLNAALPTMGGSSTSGLTTALPATATAISGGTSSFWGCVS